MASSAVKSTCGETYDGEI